MILKNAEVEKTVQEGRPTKTNQRPPDNKAVQGANVRNWAMVKTWVCACSFQLTLPLLISRCEPWLLISRCEPLISSRYEPDEQTRSFLREANVVGHTCHVCSSDWPNFWTHLNLFGPMCTLYNLARLLPGSVWNYQSTPDINTVDLNSHQRPKITLPFFGWKSYLK